MRDFLFPLRKIHGRIHEWRVNILPFYLDRFRNPRAVYLVFTPEHGNLGDHAIAQSEIEILNRLSIPYIELTEKQLNYLESNNVLKLMNGRSVLVNGGGFLGTIWLNSELLVRSIIRNNPKSRILLLPNTIYYEDDDNGQLELDKSIEIYNAHRNLKLYARENNSYAIMKEIYNNVSLSPDMVLRMNKCKDGIERKGCILCLRSDREKTRLEIIDESINKQMKSLFGKNVAYLDMVVPHSIPVSDRDEELEKQYDAFRHAELVVTDRLHGMIFCAITGTPCIVIDSKSPKVRGCYEWIKNLSYIRFCENVEEITSIYDSIPKQEWTYDNTKLLPLYDQLENDILKTAKRVRHA